MRFPGYLLTHSETFWSSVFVHFRIFSLKTVVLKYVPFFFDFWVALSAPQDGLICNPYTPAQSKHTFPFSHCFQKTASKRGHVGSILGQFSSKIAILSEKIEAKTATQKKSKSKELLATIGEIRGSLTGRLTCARFQQEKQKSDISESFSWNLSFLSPFLENFIFSDEI